MNSVVLTKSRPLLMTVVRRAASSAPHANAVKTKTGPLKDEDRLNSNKAPPTTAAAATTTTTATTSTSHTQAHTASSHGSSATGSAGGCQQDVGNYYQPTVAVTLLTLSCVLGAILYLLSRRNSTTDLEIKLSYMIPYRATSSLWGKINSYDLPIWMRTRLYDLFCRTYNCDMSEALESDYRNYRNLSEFFSRRLKPDSRPISQEPGVVSPADGLVLHFGPIQDGKIEQVKGLDYSVKTFLGLQSDDYRKELLINPDQNEIYNCIIYLAPGDYHRFHSPADWFVEHRKHFPGRLLSVRPSLVKRMPEVLHINERVCYFGNWSHGFFSMTAVGATNVGSIKVNFDEDLRTNRRHLWRRDRYACFEHKFKEQIQLLAGQDFGEFNFGSTVVLIFEAPKGAKFGVESNQKIKFGQLIARIEPWERPKQPQI